MSACCLPKHTNVYFPTFLLSYFTHPVVPPHTYIRTSPHVYMYSSTRIYVQAHTYICTASYVYMYRCAPPMRQKLRGECSKGCLKKRAKKGMFLMEKK